MDRVRVFRAAAAATAVLSVLLALSLGLTACGSGATRSSETAPSFAGTTLDGKQVGLEQYRGKPLILVYMTYT